MQDVAEVHPIEHETGAPSLDAGSISTGVGTRTLTHTDADGTQHYEMKDDQGKVVGYGTVPASASVPDQLDDRLRQAYAGLRNYINTPNASVTQAQTVTVVKLLCRVAIALVRRQLNELDGTD